mmetsp:Transcript_42823/g.50212  ORF Transcript_42823/g.50212 Transcript_42823/m.50212 type:complete len:152 (+) Transcript_42823:176-631(+)
MRSTCWNSAEDGSADSAETTPGLDLTIESWKNARSASEAENEETRSRVFTKTCLNTAINKEIKLRGVFVVNKRKEKRKKFDKLVCEETTMGQDDSQCQILTGTTKESKKNARVNEKNETQLIAIENEKHNYQVVKPKYQMMGTMKPEKRLN